MTEEELRPEYLCMIETVLRAENSDLPNLSVRGEAHYCAADRLAFIEVYGCKDKDRRRAIRARTAEMLALLGIAVEMERGRDVFDVVPIRPKSAHEILRTINAYNPLVRDRSE